MESVNLYALLIVMIVTLMANVTNVKKIIFYLIKKNVLKLVQRVFMLQSKTVFSNVYHVMLNVLFAIKIIIA